MRHLFTFLLSFCTLTLFAADPATIQKLINQHLPDAHVGIYVQRADTGEVLLNMNGRQHFTPASTAKLFTAYAALKTLGPDFQFNTRVYLNRADIQQGVYKAPIYVAFSGDPSLRSAHLAEFVRTMKTAGIKRIDGPIFLDVTSVSAPYYARGWAQEDLGWYYAAPITAAIIDENKVGLQLMVTPTAHQAIPGRVPASPPLTVTSHLVSATQSEAKHLCQFNSSMDQRNHITLYGCWPAGKGPITLKMALANPTQRVAQVLAQQLKAQGIAFNGEVKEGKTPANAVLFTQRESSPLSKLIEPVLRRSHNLYTETLTKQVGKAQHNRASFQAGAHAIERIAYDTLKIPANSIELFDGSGLSNYNIATPQSLAAVLKAGYADTHLRPILLNALSHSGKTGTLRARMATKDLLGRFIGKTGGMAHISNVAGYLFTSPNQSPLIVVVMINQTSVKKPSLRSFEIALMRHLLKTT